MSRNKMTRAESVSRPRLPGRRRRFGILAVSTVVATIGTLVGPPAVAAAPGTAADGATIDLPDPGFRGVPEPYGATAAWECSPVLRAGTKAFGDMLDTATGGIYGYGGVRPCDASWGARQSHHKTGRAIDFMVDSRTAWGRADGSALLEWLFESVDGIPHARLRRLGVVEIIWDGRIWTTESDTANTNPDPATWRPYGGLGCTQDPVGQGTECHYDHFHFTLSTAGSMGLVTFNDPSVRATPAPAPTAPGAVAGAAAAESTTATETTATPETTASAPVPTVTTTTTVAPPVTWTEEPVATTVPAETTTTLPEGTEADPADAAEPTEPTGDVPAQGPTLLGPDMAVAEVARTLVPDLVAPVHVALEAIQAAPAKPAAPAAP